MHGLDSKYQQRIKEVLGSCASFIHALPDSERVPMLAKSLGLACDLPDNVPSTAAPSCDISCTVLAEQASDTQPNSTARAIAVDICNTISSIDSQALGKFSRTHARAMGMAAIRIIDGLLQRLPNVGNVVEFAPHASLTVTRGILTSSRIHCGSISEYIGTPPIGARRTVGAKDIQTIVVNARRMYVFAEMYVDYVVAMVTKNMAIFAIIIHDNDVRVTCDSLSVITQEIGGREGLRVTVISGNEKKITSVLDVIHA